MSTLVEIMAAAQQAGVKLWTEGGELRFRAPKGALAPELRAALTARKAELVALLTADGGAALPRIPDAADYPLSSAQRRLWVLAQMDSNSSAYNIPLALLLVGALDRAALAAAIAAVVRRHESLRTVFVVVAGEPRQRVLARAEAALAERDLSSRLDPEETARAWLRAEAAKPFDLALGSLLRVTLLRLAPERYVLATTLHHIVADGTSLAVLVREVAQAYEAARRGAPLDWSPLRVHYRDYAVWQQARLAGSAMGAHRAYWLEKLAGVPPALELPADRPRPPVQTFRGRIHAFRLEQTRLRQLHALARRERASLFMVLVALVKVLLRRHTGQEDIVVASPIAGREHADLESQIGFYLNTLVLRDQVPGSAPFLAVLRAVRATALEAYEHQAYPFDQLVSELGLPRDLSRSPLCDVVVMLQNTGDLHLALAGVAARAFPVDAGVSKFDLTFDFQESAEGLEVGLEYNTDLFDADRIERLAAHFAVLTERALADPLLPIGGLDILPDAERRKLLQGFNDTAAPVPAGATIVSLLESQVARGPEAPAVVSEGASLTYAELNARANRLARRLRMRGAGPGTLVAVCLERSPDLVVALLAVLKTGAAYVPLDPIFPRERLAFMIEDSGAAVLIADGSAELPADPARAAVGPREGEGSGAENPPLAARPEHAAYVIYTSGSTGRPKGVEVRHGGLANFLLSMRERPGLSASDTLLAVTTISFDIAGLELWLPLIVGARIALVGRATAADGAALRDSLRGSGATVLQATPATWRLLLAAGWEGTPGLRMFCGGEALPGELAGQLLGRGAELWNLYGPTETTIWSTLHRVTSPDASSGTVTIGRPIANTQCHVLDSDGRPAPLGVPGELVIGGEGVAGGYWRRPELTAEKFIPDAFTAAAGGRLYRTGDVARWRPDGALEFLGRGDHQVKLRGYRIELGEIEAALAAHPDVRAAAVALREDTPGDPRLAAYLVSRRPEAPVEPADLRAFLRERLPEYMVPTAWRALAALPLTANGKVNRRALPAPEAQARPEGRDFVAPRTAGEAEVAAVWAEVLGVPRVGVNDNFFDLGGHSLKATMAVARLRQKAGGGFTLADLFGNPTVAGFAKRLTDRKDGVGDLACAIGPPVRDPAAGPAELSAAQRRLWIIEQMRPGLPVYNMPEALRLDGALDEDSLRAALRALVERHETLRTTFAVIEGEPRQIVGPAEAFVLREIDVAGAADPETQARAAAADEANAPFSLERGPLFRATLVRLGPERHLLLCTMHHIVSDAWSIAVLLRELSALYGAFAAGRPNPLPPLTARYRDFARAQNEELAGPGGAAHRNYWTGRFGGERTALALPTDFPRPAVQTAAGLTHVFAWDSGLSEALIRLGRTQGATPFMTLLALLKVLLARTTGQRDIVVGSPIAGRERVEWEGLIGFFVNTLPLRDTVERTESFRGLLARVRDTCRAAFEHQIYPFDRLVDDLKIDRDLSRPPLFDVSMQLLEIEERAGPLHGLRSEAYDHGQTPAKCDLSFNFSRTPDGFACALTYNSDLFKGTRIERMAGQLERLARSAAADPALPLGRLELLDESERNLIIGEFNPPADPGHRERSITEVFSELVLRRPGHPALLADGAVWSYGELDRRANRLAQALRGRGVGRETRVGVLLDRGLNQPLAFLAVLKAGGAYLPLDPAHPAERLRLMIADSGAALVLTQASLRDRCPVGSAAATLEEMAGEIAAAPEEAPRPPPVPAQAAYLIYTSGSTGTPKGVVVEHRGLVNTMADQAARLGMTGADRVLQFANCSFDASVFETFLALLSGAALVPATREALADPREFLELLHRRGVTVAVLPPSFVRSLNQAPLPLRILFTAGEAAWPQDVEHYRRGLTYVNGYGPTEASICSTAYVVPIAAPLLHGVPIGVPLARTQVRILDADLQPVPVGVAGEICVGGAGVARGYWRRPDLTAERFVPDAFSGEPGARLYRTGDLGRWREDGLVEFMGREDAQVKLRGFRIELGEIEAVLASHPEVREAAVLLREDRPGVPLLTAYVVVDKRGQVEKVAAPHRNFFNLTPSLRAHLAAKLPEYMIPGAFVELESFPITTAGKIDRRALPAPEQATGDFTAPSGEAETAIAGIFREVLRVADVDARASFFHLGGNSLLAIQAIGRLRDRCKAELSVLQFFAQPTVAGLASLLSAEGAPASAEIAPRSGNRPLELSFAQQRLWFLQQLDPASPAYNIPLAVRLRGQLDVGRFAAALNGLVRRHETLRTSFPSDGGRASARISPSLALRVDVADLSAFPAAEVERETRRRIDSEAARPFDLAEAPLLRLLILRTAADEHVAVLVMHHIVSDGWSMEVLVRELTRLYESPSAPLAPLPIQYADFAAWQRDRLRGETLERQMAYWRRRLADLPALALPTDRPRPARPDMDGATHGWAIPADVAAGVRRLAKDSDATVFMVLLAAFQALLHRYTGQDDIAVGTPVANRTRSELEPLIGFFVNTLVLRCDFSDRPDFRSLLRQARQTALEAFAHQEVPFEQLVQELHPERHLSHNPLFQAMFSHQSAARETLRLGGLDLTALPTPGATAKFDVTLSLEETEGEIFGALEYRTELFDAATMRRFGAHYTELLRAVTRDADARIGALNLLGTAERDQVANAWNRTRREYPARSIGELFAEQAAARRGAVAVKFGAEELTYGELDARSNRLARYLIGMGVGPDMLVPLCLERSLDLIVAILGIVKAGGAYVALDPHYPAARLALMLEDIARAGEAAPRLLVARENLLERLPENTRIVALDRDGPRIAEESASAPSVAASLDTLAYVSYTSGSTGRPKGVAVPQRGVVRLVKNTDFADLGCGETFLQLAPVAFDASTLEIWGPLLNGGRLVVAPPGTPTLEELGRILRDERITTLWLTAGLFHLMADERLEDLRGLRQLLAGGDVLSVPHVRKVLRELPNLRLINGYGPTENTTFTCCHTIRESDLSLGSVPIGRPVANTRVYILDPRSGPAPIGVPGELAAGGDGLARGYLNDPELTAEKFIADPFDPAGRLYRTGDRARWRADGTIEFLGRLDNQVKIRGYRIEPGEVEAALLAEAGVKSAAVVVRDEGGRKRLAGYVTGDVTGEGLRQSLQARLPDYLVPSAIVVLESLPLNANGKVDRAALPAPDFRAQEGEDRAAPRTDAEREIAAIWRAVLGLGHVGIHDNYFSVGGDSIGAIQVASRLKRAGWTADVRDLFQYPTIADLARRLTESGRRGPTADDRAQRPDPTGPLALTPAQAWFFEQPADDRNHFNQAILLRAREKLDAAAVETIVGKLWEHHDGLRTVFVLEQGRASALIAPPSASPGFEIVDLTGVAGAEAVRLAHTEKIHRGFDLAAGPLFKAVLYRLPAGDRLLLVAHHGVVDGVSWRILLEDLELGLRQRERGEAVDFGAKTDSVKRWTETAAALAAGDDPEAAWWDEQAALAAPAWPPASEKDGGRFGDARTVGTSLGEEATRTLLTTAHHAYHTEINDLLLSALTGALKRRQGGPAVRLVLEGHGREDIGAGVALDRTVGWFTSLFPVVLPVPECDLGAHIRRVKEALRAVPRKGVGFGLLRFLRSPERRPAAARASWPTISFNYLGQLGEESGGRFAFADESSGTALGARGIRPHEVDVGAVVVRGRLDLSITYHPGRLRTAEAESLLADFRSQLESVIALGSGREAAEKTPADFTSRVFTLSAYDALLRSRGWSAAAIDDVCRLSPMQAGLLFQTVFDAGSTAYFIQMAYRIRGDLRPELFSRAWAELGRRHAILRTGFAHEGLTTPVQLVWKERAPEMTVVDLRGRQTGSQTRAIADHRREDLSRGFDLEREPLVRVGLFRLGEDRFQVVWSYPHLLLDGWSLGVVHRDLLRIYTALAAGRPPSLPPPAPYRDYIRWLAGRHPDAARAFWSGYLMGYEKTASVPRLVRPENDSVYDYAVRILDLGPGLSARLRDAAAGAGVTLATLVQTAWGLLLARTNRSDDVVFGGIVSGRPAGLPGVEEMVGLFICAVPVRVRPRAGLPFSDLAREVQAAALEAEAHHHLPTADIQALTPLGGALFDHVVIIENYPVDRELTRPGQPGANAWAIEDVEAHDRTHYDFDLTVLPGDTLVLKFEHNLLAYPEAQVARIAAQVLAVLEQIARDPESAAEDIAIIPVEEERRVSLEFNATDAPLPPNATLVDLLAEQAARSPDLPAIVHGDQTLTYRELHLRANRLAHRLRSLGVGPETAVGLCVERSPDMFVGVLGIWKAGGAYVPLDPLYPRPRLAFMLQDSGARALVTQSGLSDLFEGAALPTVRLDSDRAAIAREQPTPPASGAGPLNLAYIIYTSGSTGQPKGVMIEHRSLVNAAGAWRRGYGEELLRGAMLQMASLSFDVFAGDLVRALTNGGCLVICDSEARIDPAGLCDLLARHRIALFESTPGLILPLMEQARKQRADLSALRLLILGSDTLPAGEYRRLRADFGSNRRIVNSYGATEATIDSCFYEDGAEGTGDSTPIGRPLANTRLYVLDDRLRPLPIGAPGELYIGGDGLARGYLNRPELTAERFIVADVAGRRQRLYRTGDLARWLSDGNLEFLGRGDGQVKVRGFRVELGEIESRLRAHPAVRDVAVVVAAVGPHSELAAYVVIEGAWEPAALRRHVVAALPEHMAPSYWLRLERLPLSPNGKVDRRALPPPGAEAAARGSEFAAPRTPLEEALARIWAEVLQAGRIGIHDNFFELGGHSLKAMQVVSRVQQEFGVKPGLRAFFQQPTVAELALQIGSARREAIEAIPAAPERDHYELSYAQQRLWLLHRMGGSSAYNMPEAYVIETPIDADALERAFRMLIARHEALRTEFIEVEGEPRQRIQPLTQFRLKRVDLGGDPRGEARARELADREAAEPFDLARPPLLRATLIALGARRTVFLFTMHHIIGDGWSGNVLYREVFALYAAARRGAPDPLRPLRIHYKDFAVWQKARGFESDERYWLQRLAAVPAALALPYDFTPGAERDFRGDAVAGEIDAEAAAALRRLALARKTTLSNVVLALFKLLLFQLTKQEDLCVGVSVANRGHPDLEGLIGFFVNILPVRVRLTEAMEFEELLDGVAAACEEAFEHQDYPFDLLVQKLNPARATNRQPLLNVIYAFQNFADVHVAGAAGRERAAEAEIEPARAFEHAFKTSKFDLTLFVSDDGEKLLLTLEYDTGLFRAETIGRYLALLRRFAGALRS